MSTCALLAPGESATFAGYQLEYEAPFIKDEAHRTVQGGELRLLRDDSLVAILRPSASQYPGRLRFVATPALRVGLDGDLLVWITRFNPEAIEVDMYRYPLMWMLWAGGLITAGGAALALLGRRRPATDAPREVEHEGQTGSG